MKFIWLFSIAIILNQYSLCISTECPIEDNDAYILIPLLQNAILGSNETVINLAGVFFADQKKPPYSVQVHYTVCIPYNQDCQSRCTCWEDVCGNETGTCPDGHCTASYSYIWGSIPQIASDEVYRSLVICPFMIGGIKQKLINIQLNLTSNGLPCSWCHAKAVEGYFFHYPTLIENAFLLTTTVDSPMEKALEAITAKLRGYGAKMHTLPWLKYSSDLAFGYAARHHSMSSGYPSTWNQTTFALAYVMFNVVIFMLVYKYRYRLYNRVYRYVTRDRISSSLLWSFIFTSTISSIIVITISFFADGWCMTIYQVILLIISLFFCFLHLSIASLKLRKSHKFPVMLAHVICIRSAKINKAIQIFMFFYFYSIPHISTYIIVLLSVNFLFNPFGYLILIVYFTISFTATWIANALAIYLLTPNCFACKHRKARRHALFAFFVAGAFNFFNTSLSIFMSVYFYDMRGASNSTGYMTIIPGLVITFIGWYISGDLSKLFKFVSLDKISKEDKAVKRLSLCKEDEDKEQHVQIEEARNLMQVRAKNSNSTSKLRKLANAVQRVRSAASILYEDSSDDTDDTDIDGQMQLALSFEMQPNYTHLN